MQPPELADAPPLPGMAAHVWGWFIDMHNSDRPSNGMTAQRISSSGMRDWQWASGVELELWERKALRRLDAVWVTSQSKEQ